MPKLTNGNVTPVSGSTARLPATVTASWQSASTTQATPIQREERLVVVDHATRRRDEARLAARRRGRDGESAGAARSRSRCVTAHATVQPNTPTSAVNV